MMRQHSYYTPIGGLGIHHLGKAADDATTPPAEEQTLDPELRRRLTITVYGVAIASSGASAYHGYKRNRDSAGAAVGWGLLGFIFPIITPIVALAQGYGDPKVNSNRRRRRTSRRR